MPNDKFAVTFRKIALNLAEKCLAKKTNNISIWFIEFCEHTIAVHPSGPRLRFRTSKTIDIRVTKKKRGSLRSFRLMSHQKVSRCCVRSPTASSFWRLVAIDLGAGARLRSLADRYRPKRRSKLRPPASRCRKRAGQLPEHRPRLQAKAKLFPSANHLLFFHPIYVRCIV